ncbi:MAG: heavy metal-responsive transcriptional regulator [Myxococcota bacterium]
MKIGEVARAAGIGIDAIRFYERQGLIEKPARRPSGYRVYGPQAVSHLRFIKRAKELGFSLKEISELLSLDADSRATAGDVKALAEQKLGDIEERIRALRRMQRALRRVAEGCPGQGPTSGCSILRSLNGQAH